MKRNIGLLAVLLVLGSAAAFAAEGRMEIFEPVVLSGPGISGRYFLSRDIVAAAGASAIVITGTGIEEVDIDLNGFLVRGEAGGADVILASDLRTLVLRNGTIKSPVTCPCPSTDVIRINSVGAGASARVVLEGLKITGGHDAVKLIQVANYVIARNFILDADHSGITAAASAITTTGVIEENLIREVGDPTAGFGIDISDPTEGLTIRKNIVSSRFVGVAITTSSGLTLDDNHVFGGGASGGSIHVFSSDSCTVINNRTSNSVGSGIKLRNTDNCLVADNVSNGHGRNGISLEAASGNLVVGNVTNDNVRDGIGIEAALAVPSDKNTVDRNVTNDNGRYGIHFDPTSGDNRYGRNSAVGNTGNAAPCIVTCGTPPDLCDEGPAAPNVSFGDNLVPGVPPC